MTPGRRLVVLTVTCAALLLPTAVAAHPWADWHIHRWTTTVIGGIQTDRNVDWRFVDNVPSGDGTRARIRDAAARWSNVGTSLSFNFGSNEAAGLGWGTCPNSYQDDRVGWTNIGSSGFSHSEPLGQAQNCHFSSNTNAAWSFKIRFNKDAPWYTGTGTPPSDRYDLWSLAMHEFGHVTGRYKGGDGNGHFRESSDYCPGPKSSSFSWRHTMCPSIYIGKTNQRTLETHDKDVLQNAY
jgi:hypothetical protein